MKSSVCHVEASQSNRQRHSANIIVHPRVGRIRASAECSLLHRERPAPRRIRIQPEVSSDYCRMEWRARWYGLFLLQLFNMARTTWNLHRGLVRATPVSKQRNRPRTNGAPCEDSDCRAQRKVLLRPSSVTV